MLTHSEQTARRLLTLTDQTLHQHGTSGKLNLNQSECNTTLSEILTKEQSTDITEHEQER